MTDETKNATAGSRHGPKPFEQVLERLRLTDRERAEINAQLSDPDRVPKKVEWLDAGRDPFGMNWGWLTGDESEKPPSD